MENRTKVIIIYGILMILNLFCIYDDCPSIVFNALAIVIMTYIFIIYTFIDIMIRNDLI